MLTDAADYCHDLFYPITNSINYSSNVIYEAYVSCAIVCAGPQYENTYTACCIMY